MRYTSLAATGAAATALLACAGGQQQAPAPVSQQQQPKRGGTITVSRLSSQLDRTFDPHTNSAVRGQAMRMINQGVLVVDHLSLEIQPEIAQRWEQPSPTEYIFTLQPGIKWHNKPPANGRALTVEDVVFSLNRARTNDPRFQIRTALDSAQRIEAVDATRLRITTQNPDAPFLRKLASDGLLILAADVVEKADKFATVDEAVGTGPFIVTQHEAGVGDVYVRNNEYWKPGLPYLDGMRGPHFADLQTAYAAFLAGQADVVQLPGPEVKKYLSQPGVNEATVWCPNGASFFVHFNTKQSPFDDTRVTRALRLLIDYGEMRTQWAELWYGRGRNTLLLDPALEMWDLGDEEYGKYLYWKQPKDEAVREATSLLSAAGFNASNPLRFRMDFQDTNGAIKAASELIQNQWKRFSQGVVDIQINFLDQVAVNQARSSRNFAVLNAGNAGSMLDPDAWLGEMNRTNGSRNYAGFSDPTFDAMLDRQRTIFNETQRKAAVRELIIYMIDRTPITVYSGIYIPNAANARVREYKPVTLTTVGRQYENVWLDS
jgi:ABC-type transport system substrate-binding protein